MQFWLILIKFITCITSYPLPAHPIWTPLQCLLFIIKIIFILFFTPTSSPPFVSWLILLYRLNWCGIHTHIFIGICTFSAVYTYYTMKIRILNSATNARLFAKTIRAFIHDPSLLCEFQNLLFVPHARKSKLNHHHHHQHHSPSCFVHILIYMTNRNIVTAEIRKRFQGLLSLHRIPSPVTHRQTLHSLQNHPRTSIHRPWCAR